MKFLVNFLVGFVCSITTLLALLFGFYYWATFSLYVVTFLFGAPTGIFSFLFFIAMGISPLVGLGFALDMKIKL